MFPRGAQRAFGRVRMGRNGKGLFEKGLRVKAVPIDSVIAVNAEARGVEIVYGDANKRAKVGQRALRLYPVFQHAASGEMSRPNSCLASPNCLLREGRVIASAPNLIPVAASGAPAALREDGQSEDYESSGMHASTGRLLRRWFRQAGLRPDKIVYEIMERGKKARRLIDARAGKARSRV